VLEVGPASGTNTVGVLTLLFLPSSPYTSISWTVACVQGSKGSELNIILGISGHLFYI
jgi:hypothetical protein